MGRRRSSLGRLLHGVPSVVLLWDRRLALAIKAPRVVGRALARCCTLPLIDGMESVMLGGN